MSETLTAKGTVKKIYGKNAMIIDGTTYSQYGGLDPMPSINDVVEFKFKTKEQDGKVYNNVISGSLAITAKSPKDVTESYSAGDASSKNHFSPAREKSIIRQSCLKAAVEMVCHAKAYQEGVNVLELAENFEKWVNRE